MTNYNKWLFPIHDHYHWYALQTEIERSSGTTKILFTVYDSLMETISPSCKQRLSTLAQATAFMLGTHVEWLSKMGVCSPQTNNSDCGLHTLNNLEYLYRGLAPTTDDLNRDAFCNKIVDVFYNHMTLHSKFHVNSMRIEHLQPPSTEHLLCPGITHPLSYLLVHDDGTVRSKGNVIGLSIDSVIRSMKSDMHVPMSNRCAHCCTLYENSIRKRLKTLSQSIESGIEKRPFSKYDTPALLRLKAERWKKIANDNEKKVVLLSESLEQIAQNPDTILQDSDSAKQKAYLLELTTKVLSLERLPTKSFLFHYLTNTFENLLGTSNNNRYSDEIIRFWLLVKYYGGKKIIQLLRGKCHTGTGNREAKLNKDFNFLVPSLQTLKQYTPRYQYGSLSEAKLTEIKNKLLDLNSKTILGLAWDETDVRNGLVFSKKHGILIGAYIPLKPAEALDHFENGTLSNKVGDQAVQFFLVDAAGTIAIPVGFWAKNKKHTDHSDFIIEKLKYYI